MWDEAPKQKLGSSTVNGLLRVLTATLVVLAAVGFARPSGTAASPTGGSFAFLKHQPGTPSVHVTWSSCKPIHVVVNGSSTMSDPVSGKEYYVSGRIALDTPALTKALGGASGADGCAA